MCAAPNNFGSNLTKSIIALPIDPTGEPYGPDNPIPVTTSAAAGATYTDRSGTITLGGTSQQIAAANTSRTYFFITNISDTIMYLNFGTAAVAGQPSIPLAANGGFYEPLVPSGQTINLICATTGKAFVAKEA